MSNVSLEKFLPGIVIDTPGVTKEVALHHTRNVCIDFCEESCIIQDTLDPITLLQGVTEYDLEAPNQTRVGKVMTMWFHGRELIPAAPDMISKPDPYLVSAIPGYTPGQQPPTHFTQKTPNSFSLLNQPDQRYPNAITIRAALVPLRDCTEVDDYLWENWGDVIQAGAKARLMMSPGKPYSNMESAAVYQNQYLAGRNDAQQAARRGLTRANLRMKLRRI